MATRHQGRIGDDPVEPAVERRRVAQAGQLSPGGHERVLGRVGRVGFVGKDRPGQAVAAIDPGIDEDPERRRITGAGAANERVVGRRRRLRCCRHRIHVTLGPSILALACRDVAVDRCCRVSRCRRKRGGWVAFERSLRANLTVPAGIYRVGTSATARAGDKKGCAVKGFRSTGMTAIVAALLIGCAPAVSPAPSSAPSPSSSPAPSPDLSAGTPGLVTGQLLYDAATGGDFRGQRRSRRRDHGTGSGADRPLRDERCASDRGGDGHRQRRPLHGRQTHSLGTSCGGRSSSRTIRARGRGR